MKLTSETGHTWPCTGFYVTSSEEDRTVGCTCGKKVDHLEAAIQAGMKAIKDDYIATCEKFGREVEAFGENEMRHDSDLFTDAALPHLRRAIIQELADEAEEVYEEASDNAYGAYSWLTEKLKEAEGND